jgi:hypothetical protein
MSICEIFQPKCVVTPINLILLHLITSAKGSQKYKPLIYLNTLTNNLALCFEGLPL